MQRDACRNVAPVEKASGMIARAEVREYHTKNNRSFLSNLEGWHEHQKIRTGMRIFLFSAAQPTRPLRRRPQTDHRLGTSTMSPPGSTWSAPFSCRVIRRVAVRARHKVEFIATYGGSIVKPSDVIKGVQSGVVDISGYCWCFEPSNLPMHAFPVMMPLG